MTAIFEKIAFYWTYPFVRYALIVGVLIALCSLLLGVTLVRLHLYPDAVKKRGLAVCGTVRGGRGGVSALLQQDLCRDL